MRRSETLAQPRPIRDTRYEIVRKLGEGGLGVVYEAHDKERGIPVALKTLKRPTQEAAFHLKQEFRRLSGIDHPNLVNLYDLHVSPEELFFTMELVPGSDILSYVRSGTVDIDADTMQLPEEMLDSLSDDASRAPTLQSGAALLTGLTYDEARLRSVLSQLVFGLDALHGFGKIHRDIKPSNIRVNHDGKVKILDFGLAIKIDSPADASSSGQGSSGSSNGSGGIVGTLNYMSPEQAAAEPRLGPATDWYAVGVLLFQALTGELPFQGRPIQVLAQKTQFDAPTVRSLHKSAPEDLSKLCDRLLARDAADRIRSRAILELFSGRKNHVVTTQVPSVNRGQDVFFVGREKERESIRAAFEEVQATRSARTVVVSGPSGIGKSSLIQQALVDIAANNAMPAALDITVLRGRCYEWEKVSYKAMDGVIDELSTHWAALDREDAARLLPRDAHLLSVLFPVLDRVHAVSRARKHNVNEVPQAMRDHAFSAIRETFDRLTLERQVVLYLDDMQWADEDTVGLLKSLLRAPKEPALLLILNTRPQGLQPGTPLSELLAELGDAAETIALPPLGKADSILAARALLGAENAALICKAAEEAEGNPYYLTELAYSLREKGDAAVKHGAVDDLIRERVSALPDSERCLLEVLCVAGGPIGGDVARDASNLSPASLATATKNLRHKNLLRSASANESGTVAPYHDRVRHAICDVLPDSQAALVHASLARAFEVREANNPGRIVRHWLGAKETSKAATWSLCAADAALATLNFTRAADFLETAMTHGSHSESERRQLQVRLADALVEAGSPRKAANAYEIALGNAPAESESVELRRRITENLMFAGDIDSSLRAAKSLSTEFRLTYPSTRATTLMHMVLGEVRLARAKLEQHADSDADAFAAQRVDVAESLAMGLSGADALRSMVFTQQWALHSLKVGDPARCARALASLSILASMQNAPSRSYKYLDAAQVWSQRDGDPVNTSYVISARALASFYLENNWQDARNHFGDALDQWKTGGRGYSHAIGVIYIFRSYAASYQGDLRELVDGVPKLIEEASRSGNRVLESSLRAGFAHRHLITDDAERGEDDLLRFLEGWPDRHFLWQHWLAILRGAEIQLYLGRPERALELIEENRGRLRNSMLTQLHFVKCEFVHIQARCHLALAAAKRDQRSSSLKRTEGFAKTLSKSNLDLAKAWSHLLYAAVACSRNRSAQARTSLQRAHALFEKSGSLLYANATLRRIGELTVGSSGERAQAKADIWLARQGIRKPSRMLDMIAPGF